MAKAEGIVQPKIKIKVLGIGGGGNNVLVRVGKSSDLDLELIGINSDVKQLNYLQRNDIRAIAIGETVTRGRGTGGRADIARQIAEAEAAKLKDVMAGADIVFLIATMGAGFGTGAAPVIARLARESGILTVGVVTEPFDFEGPRKKETARQGIDELRAQMDALIVIDNQKLTELPENRSLKLTQAFKAADSILEQAIGSVAELILKTGFINVDFADVTTIFRHSASSDALLCMGRSRVNAVEAVKNAVNSPLLTSTLDGSRAIILNLTANAKVSMFDVNDATSYITELTGEGVDMIFGMVIDDSMDGEISATIIATDFQKSTVQKAPVVKLDVPKPAKDAGKDAKDKGKDAKAAEKPAAKKDNLSAPSFMQKRPTGPRGAFAIPAFKITGADPKKDQ